MTKSCGICGAAYEPTNNRQRYCSAACRREAKNRAYRERMAADPEWRGRRLAQQARNNAAYELSPEQLARKREKEAQRVAKLTPELREERLERIRGWHRDHQDERRERYATDKDYRDRLKRRVAARHRRLFTSDPEYRTAFRRKSLATSRRRRADPEKHAAELARREELRSDPAYRSKELARDRTARQAPHRKAALARANARRRAHRAGYDQDTGELITIEQLLERDGYRCCLCGDPVDPELAWPDRMSATMEHLMPIVRGGRHVLANLAPAHLTCNVRTGNRYRRPPARARK